MADSNIRKDTAIGENPSCSISRAQSIGAKVTCGNRGIEAINGNKAHHREKLALGKFVVLCRGQRPRARAAARRHSTPRSL